MFEVEVQIEVEVDGPLGDAPTGAVGVADALWEEGRALYLTETPGRLVLGFAEREPAEEAARRLGGALIDVESTPRVDLDAWRAWARPTRVGRLVVRPSWHSPGRLAAGDVDIAIDPGHAFGHGGHPSTRLVLAALVGRLAGGESVLDVGCGSGVLSVAAVALGAESVRAVDIDPTAVAVTRANAVANGTSQRIDVDSTPLAAIRRRFDVVVANIGVVVLRELAPDLTARVAGGGWIAFSGLLEHQWAEVVELSLGSAGRAAGPVSLISVEREDGWAAPLLAVGRPPASSPRAEAGPLAGPA